MLIQKLDPDKLTPAYGILCQHLWTGIDDLPVSSTLCVVEPGEVARAHQHQEHESFVIIKGRGRMTVDGESAEVGAGDAVLMKPFSSHELANLSDGEELVFLDLCWEDLAVAAAANREGLAAATPTTAGGRRSVVVTATPPTPNGNLHVGHLSGPYLSADVFTRYLKLRGHRALYLSGVDDHQSYTEVRGIGEGASARAIADRFGDAMEETLRRAAVEMDVFARPQRSPYHTAMVQEVFAALYESGALVAREAPTLYCEPCGRYLFEAHVSGRCPHCGEGSGGNACEACGWPNDCVDLVDPRCKHCGGEPAVRPLTRIYFPLAPFAERLREYWAGAHLNPHLRALCEDMLTKGLPDIAVSQQTDWGIPVPVAGFEDQRIYVWFEMGPGYLAATQEALDAREPGASWRDAWCSEEREVVQFFGFDNGYFHGVLFPATFFAWDPAIRPPRAFVTNEFYRYEGSKFSTSRNHALWGPELLDRVPVDSARFYLAYDCPERAQNNFTLAALQETVARELLGEWEPWLRSLGARLIAEFAGAVPSTGAWTDEHRHFYQALISLTAEAAAAYEAETFSPQRATRVCAELVRTARRFAAAEEHWRRLPSRFEERRTALALEVLAAKVLAVVAAPVMPGFAARLWADLGFDGPLRWEEVPEFVPGGRKVEGLDRSHFTAVEEPRHAAIG